jgi:2-methylcitrate dehydratase PrpD
VAAVALIDGACRQGHFADACVEDPAVRAVRDRVRARADRVCGIDEARVVLRLRDGRVVSHRVDHCLGSPTNPLTDAMLAEKFHAAADGRLPAGRAAEVVAMVWELDCLPDVRALGRALVSEPA